MATPFIKQFELPLSTKIGKLIELENTFKKFGHTSQFIVNADKKIIKIVVTGITENQNIKI